MSEWTCLGLATRPLQVSVMTVGSAQVQGHDYHYYYRVSSMPLVCFPTNILSSTNIYKSLCRFLESFPPKLLLKMNVLISTLES